MKAVFRIGWISLLATIAVQAQTSTNVVTPNIVGYVKVDAAASNLTIIAVPFNPAGSSTNNIPLALDQFLSTNLVASGDSPSADEVFLWTGNGYKEAWLNDDSWGPDTAWKWCFQGSDGNPVPCASTNIFDVSVGQGLWLKNRHDAKTLYFSGEVPMAATTSVAMAQGLLMIANPYPVERTLDQLISTNSGAHASGDSPSADEIFLWTGNGYYEAWLNDDSWGPDTAWKWCFQGSDGNPVPCASTNLFTVKPGQGWWYLNRGGTFTNSLPRPY